MGLDIQGMWELPNFDLASLRVEGYLLLGLYALALLALLYARRHDFRALTGRKWLLFVLLLLLAVPLNNLLWLRFPTENILPPPSVPNPAPAPSVPLLGMFPVMVTGLSFGAGPAIAVGFVAGLVRGGLDNTRVLASSELAVIGLVMGFLLRQTYRGRDWRALRQPLLVALVAAVSYWTLLWAGIYASAGGSGLNALDYTRSLLFASIGAIALDCLVSAGIVQGLVTIFPKLRPGVTGNLIPPHLRSLNRRLLAAFIPLTLVMIVAMFYAVTAAATQEAVNQVFGGMKRGAKTTSQMIPHFFNTGQELLTRFATNDQLWSQDAAFRQQALAANLESGINGPFFSQFLIVGTVDEEQKTLNAFPEGGLPTKLLPTERDLLERTLEFGSPEHSRVFAIDGHHAISFIVPLEDDAGQIVGALVGRSLLQVNPALGQILSSLQWSAETSSSLVLDDQCRIALHPDSDRLLTKWFGDTECADLVQMPPSGRSYQDLAPDSTRRLIYYLPATATQNWTIIVTYPYELVLDRATRISRPLVFILLAVTAVIATAVPWVTSRLTRPLQILSTAAHGIARGQLDNHVAVTGEDEVGQLGGAFEQMRQSLKGRLDDLSLLLQVSQVVSSSLDVSQGIPPILEGALQATEARFARLIFLDEHGEPQNVSAQGTEGRYVTALDRAIVRLTKKTDPVLVQDVARARGVIEPSLLDANVRALIAMPARSKDHLAGVLWLAYGEPHAFGATEINFLSTLASQAAVVIENAQLFQTAEGERRRLAAILESTGDAVIVTDHANRVLLINRSATDVFRVDAQTVTGRPIDGAIQEQTVVRLLTAEMDDGAPLTGEIPLPDGRTFYASASSILSRDDQAMGRVAMLRDITYLKELDEMKSEFVATVSHDLRAPLTFMRGYATMIPMVDQVSPKQKSYVEKILVGIEQMTELIDDLLDLGRIEAGVGLMREPCRLDEIIVAQMDAMRPRAKTQGLTLRLDRTEDITLVVGDAALLRRIVANLIDNAIKYTPQGGSVTVNWETRGDRVLIGVADTGIGIAKKDQVRLFEKFSRIKRRETINIKGSGLGLAIVKSIAERHDGRVWVESELEQGSTFFVELPIGQVD